MKNTILSFALIIIGIMLTPVMFLALKGDEFDEQYYNPKMS